MYFHTKGDDGRQKRRQTTDFGEIVNTQTELKVDELKWDRIFHNWERPEFCANRKKVIGCKVCEKLISGEAVEHNGKFYQTGFPIFGDIHGAIGTIYDVMQEHKFKLTISTGDLCLYPSLQSAYADKKAIEKNPDQIANFLNIIRNKLLQPFNFKLNIVKGNHDPYEKEDLDALAEFNMLYPEDGGAGTLLQVYGINILIFGGIFSKNKILVDTDELSGRDKRYFTFEDIAKCLDKYQDTKIDILITHQACTDVLMGEMKSGFVIDHEEGCEHLNSFLHILQPDVYIHGHHHVTYEKTINVDGKNIAVYGLGNLNVNPKAYLIYEPLSKKVTLPC